ARSGRGSWGYSWIGRGGNGRRARRSGGSVEQLAGQTLDGQRGAVGGEPPGVAVHPGPVGPEGAQLLGGERLLGEEGGQRGGTIGAGGVGAVLPGLRGERRQQGHAPGAALAGGVPDGDRGGERIGQHLLGDALGAED